MPTTINYPVIDHPGLIAISDAIQAAIAIAPSGLAQSNGTLAISFANPLTAPQAAIVDAVVEPHLRTDLAAYITELVDIVDLETNRRIEEVGFAFAGKTFGSTIYAQIKWVGLFTIRNEPVFTYPATIRTMDDSEEFVIPDAVTVYAMYLTLAGTVRARLDAGRLAKAAIIATTTVIAARSAHDTYMAAPP